MMSCLAPLAICQSAFSTTNAQKIEVIVSIFIVIVIIITIGKNYQY